jgi:hypothetical protein
MATPLLTAYQRDLAQLYRARLGSLSEVGFFDFSFASADASKAATVKVARLQLTLVDGSSLWATGTLGSERITGGSSAAAHEHQFIGVFDSGSLELSEFIAALYHFDLKVEALGDGHTVPLGQSSNLRRTEYSSGLVLRGEYLAPFAQPMPRLAGVDTTLFSVVVITEAEAERKRERGLEALMQEWRRSRRDSFHVDVSEPS